MIGSITSGAPSSTAALPESSPLHSGALSPEEQLLVLLVYSDMAHSNEAKSTINLSQDRLNQLRDEAAKAIAAAREAQEHSGFWGKICAVLNGDVAAIAEVVAVAAAAVATGGAAVAVLAAISIGAGLASKYADKLGIPPSVAIGLGIAAGLASVASGNLGSGVSAMTALQSGAQTVHTGAEVVSVGATAAGVVTGEVSKDYSAEAVDYQADQRSAEQQQVLVSSDIDESLQVIQRELDRQLAFFQANNQIIQEDHRSAQLVLQNFAGAA